ncbi:MAG: hypothetical protein QXO69_00050 [archaeon]
MDIAIKRAKESAGRVKRRTSSYARADAEKVRVTSELITGYLEAMINLSWKKDGDESVRSSLASSMQIIEELTDDALEQISKTRDYKKTGVTVKKFYGRVNSVLKRVPFSKIETLAK